MNARLDQVLDPQYCALVFQEVQEGVVGANAIFPELAAVARDVGLVENCSRLASAARVANVPVFHCTAETREDRLGANTNARLFAAAQKAPVGLHPGTEAVRVPASIGFPPEDVVLPRYHGVGPLTGTQLDPILRNLGVRTIVAAGVSLNVGMLDLIITAVNLGYQVVVPREAVAGVPKEYGEQVLTHTVSVLATITDVDTVAARWCAHAAAAGI